MADPRFFCWVDLETTGLNETLDPIIEVGLVITDISVSCNEVDSYEAVALPEDPQWQDRMDSFVQRMHSGNGLLTDIEDHGRPLKDIENEILSLLMKHGRPHNFMLAGSGVGHFDRRFIKAQMPGFDKWLQHPCLDVGIFRRGIKFSGRQDLTAFGHTFQGDYKPHRGLADVRDHLNEWREYASLLNSYPMEEDSVG